MRIRVATGRDAAGIAAIYAPIVRDTAISFETEVPSPDEIGRRVADTLSRLPWLIAGEDDGSVTGYAYAAPHRARAAYRWCCEVSAYVRADRRRRGVARGLYVALLRILERQGYRNAYAGITLPNDASVGLHESLGFRPVGVYRRIGHKLGEWYDVGWWQRDLAPHDATPGEPIAFGRLLESGDLTADLEAGTALFAAGPGGP
jgi:phosphinothricin acetyltransferase